MAVHTAIPILIAMGAMTIIINDDQIHDQRHDHPLCYMTEHPLRYTSHSAHATAHYLTQATSCRCV